MNNWDFILGNNSVEGSKNLGIDDLTIGVSRKGMEQYKHELKISVLNETKDKIDDVDNVVKAINNCWQGQARDKFLSQFAATREKIKEDLKREYNDLEQRLIELEHQYYDQDKSMMEGE